MNQPLRRKDHAGSVDDEPTSKGRVTTSLASAKSAQVSLVELVRFVIEHKDGPFGGMTYEELARRIGRINKRGRGQGHGMGSVLSKMGQMLKDLQRDYGEQIPDIQSLVVAKTGKDKSLPSSGISEFWPDYPNMSHSAKSNCVAIEHTRIQNFGSKWNDVLKRLRLPPIEASDFLAEPQRRIGSGGESPWHKLLKSFVRKNPEIVGAEGSWESFEEYPLPSLDTIDVVFKSDNTCIAVEVKSRASDQFPTDYERGLYQSIKYGAILRAMFKAGNQNIPARVESVLVLESKLPREYREVAKTLGVVVYENVRPSGLVNP